MQEFQNSVTILVSLFRRVGLDTNVVKTKTQTCHPGSIRTGISAEAYTRRTTGRGYTYRQRLRRRVTCPECGKDLAASSLTQYRHSQHGTEPEINWSALNIAQAEAEPITYVVSFPGALNQCLCPVEDCSFIAKSRSSLLVHFQRRHWKHLIHIQEEHPLPYPKCQRCDLQLPPERLNNSHFNSGTCRMGIARKRQREAELLSYRANNVYFTINGSQLERVRTVKYLGRLVSDTNSDWPALYHNLKKAQARWANVARILDKEGASMRCRGLFYKAVVQSVLLYGCETWTVTDAMMRVLEGFHHRVARRITGNQARRLPNGEWEYPPLAPALEQAGLWLMREYVRRRQAHIIQQVATRPIYTLCEEAQALSGSSRSLKWWEQDHTVAGVGAGVVEEDEEAEVDGDNYDNANEHGLDNNNN